MIEEDPVVTLQHSIGLLEIESRFLAVEWRFHLATLWRSIPLAIWNI
jgi:hypothetical protein